jgi:predicted RNA-binding protein (virulence factor B family)
MPSVGKYNKLKIVKELDFGIYLDGAELGEILLPKRYVPDGVKPGDEIDVFLYFDSEDRIIATTEKPLACVGDFALLRVASVNAIGAFMDWGLPKDLLVPFSEQKKRMEEGRSYIIHIFYDRQSKRIAASAKLEQFLDKIPPEYEPRQKVDLLVWQSTDLGYKVIVNDFHKGILYHNEVFQPLNIGQRVDGYIKKVREDGKIDLSLYPPGKERVEDNASKILEYLRQHDGYMTISDKTDPEIIYNTFGISKKTFKSTLGNLYKNKQVLLEPNGVKLIKEKEA